MIDRSTSAGTDVDKLEKEFQNNPSLFVELAQAYIERKLPQQALRVSKAGLRRSPNTPNG